MHTLFPNKTVSTVIVFLVLLNIVTWIAYKSESRELALTQSAIANAEQSKNILAFQKLFVEKVLNSNGTVDYDTRRSLEQSAGKTNDESVIAAWNAFLDAKTEIEGQARLKELLLTLADRAYAGK